MELVYVFFTGSVFGWCLETVFRRFCKSNISRKWINPGFLTGPYLPLYGFGLCTLYLLAELEKGINIGNPILLKIAVVILMTVCMTLLELIAGLIFVRGMNLKLWDYSDKPLNYKGIICPEFSFYWMILGMVYYFGLHGFMCDFTNLMTASDKWLFHFGFLAGVFSVDVGYSIQIAAKIKKFAAENNILVRYEELKATIRKHAEERREKYSFIFAMYSKEPLSEHLKKYYEANKMIRELKKRVHDKKIKK